MGKLPNYLVKTGVMFKKNTKEDSCNTFELFVNILDIYDRLIYHNNMLSIKQITETPNIYHQKKQRLKHFAFGLEDKDINDMNETFDYFKCSKNSFFRKLETKINAENKINDN